MNAPGPTTSAMPCPSRPGRAVLGRWAFGFALAAGFGLASLVAPASSHAWPPYGDSQPTIMGTAQQGQTLTAARGPWTGWRTSYSYQWLRCNSSGESCVTIPGATAQTYVPIAEDVGHELRVQQTAKDFGYFGRPESSAATAVVVPEAPTNTPLVEAPPPATPVVVSRRAVTINRQGEAPIEVSCPAGARDGCRGTVTVQLSEPPARRARALAARCARGCRPLGTAKYEARAGHRIRVRVHIASVGRRLLARRKALRVSLTVTSVSGASTATTALTTTLKAAA